MMQLKLWSILILLIANNFVCAGQVDLVEYEDYTLSNGLRIFIAEDRSNPTVFFQLRMDMVPINEKDLAGISELMGNMLLSGTKAKSSTDIQQTIEFLSAQVETSGNGIYASCPARNSEDLLRALSEIISVSNFPIAEFEKQKAQMASSLVASENDLKVVSQRVGDVVRFKKGFPYGVVATEQSLDNISREHLQAYYDRFFVPNNAYLVVVGDVRPLVMIPKIEGVFSEWRTPKPIATSEVDQEILSLAKISEVKKYPKGPDQNHVVFVDMPGAQECVIDITYPVHFSPNDPFVISADVMNSALNRRLSEVFTDQELREDQETFSSLRSDEYIGSFSAKVMVKNSLADSAIYVILSEMERMVSEGIDKKELKAVKGELANKFADLSKDPYTASGSIVDQIIFDLKEDHYTSYLEKLDTISRSAVQAMARVYLKPKNANIFVVGNKEATVNKLAKFSDRSGIEFLDKNGDRYREKLQLPPAGVSAQQVIDAHYSALGGKSKLHSRETEKIVMTAQIEGATVEYVSYRKAPSKYLMTLTVDGNEKLREVYNGSKGVRMEQGRTMELVDIHLDELSYAADMNFGMNYPELSFDLSFVGISNVKGRPANKVRIITESGIPIEEYFDVETELLVKRIEMKYTTEGQKQKVTYYDDYQEVDDILYPHIVTELFDEQRIYQAKSISINEKIDDELFLIP